MRTGRAKGFTLVEMIVAIVIAASLGAVIYTTFAQGVRLWTRAAKDRGEWKVDLWVEKMTGELRNAFQDPRWVFKGGRTELFSRPCSMKAAQALRVFRPIFITLSIPGPDLLSPGGLLSKR